MSNRMIRIHNQETNEVIDREMTAEELAQFETENAARAEAKATKIAEKSALLDKLGITEDEARLLLG